MCTFDLELTECEAMESRHRCLQYTVEHVKDPTLLYSIRTGLLLPVVSPRSNEKPRSIIDSTLLMQAHFDAFNISADLPSSPEWSLKLAARNIAAVRLAFPAVNDGQVVLAVASWFFFALLR